MEFFMGQVLAMPELPANSPRPPETPPEGVIVVDQDPDGMTRRYLYKAMAGAEPSQVLISELPTADMFVPSMGPEHDAVPVPFLGASTPVASMAAPKPAILSGRNPNQPKMGQNSILMEAKKKLGVAPMAAEQKAETVGIQTPRGPKIGEIMPLAGTPAHGVALPSKVGPMPVDDTVIRETVKPVPMTQMGSPNSFLDHSVKMAEKTELSLGHVPQKTVTPGTPLGVYPMAERKLGQTNQAPAPSAPPAAPAAPAAAAVPPAAPGKCPGAVEMPDGRVINPDDGIMLQDLCELMPFLLESYGALQSQKQGENGPLAPGKSVPVVGQQPSASGAVPSTASQFGPAGSPAGGSGPFGYGGGGFVGGGGGGPGPTGPQGAVGPQGGTSGAPPDGIFLNAPGSSFTSTGAPVVIPNYLVNFNVGNQGPVTIRASANFTSPLGSTFPDVTFGLQVDGTDYVLAVFEEQQGAGQDKVFNAHLMIELFIPSMAPGPHVVQGIYSGGFPGAEMTFVAEPTMGATMVVEHQ